MSPDKAILDDEETSDSSSSSASASSLPSCDEDVQQGFTSIHLDSPLIAMHDTSTTMHWTGARMPSSLDDAHSEDTHSTVTETISNTSPPWNLYDNTSYHRIIMAPPGKIGITFVDLEGVAMVSHISNESPLYGWIFLEDILVAIDECNVNDMQVKDIVQLLLDRKDKQRALCVMSAHAMASTLCTREPSEVMI